ncbi:DegT/DnrJ/EryC1/StrS family aminotransferase [Streptomyces natalensis]|uniref:DegT/DnrJ/EryC1/StrS family aminotransferase n=1 Tax=Streptomyces natalensis TaxID=68242 RepID=UPI00056372B4|nr:DegT/DnrJ/EryC1/StrS family aminotransferase [Streptomyces natalensis]
MVSKNQIWANEPALGAVYTQAEVDAVLAALHESMDPHIGFRAKNREMIFEDAFGAYCGAQFAIAYNGAGTALDMVLHCLDLRPGDEVISGALNFVGAHVSVIRQGGKLVLSEIDPATLNLDPADVERRISDRTRAILVTHMNGMPADMKALERLAARHEHPVFGPPKLIIDAARACGAEDGEGPVGSRGWATIFSFQSKKLMTTLGEGGMVTTQDVNLAKRLRRLRSFGKNEEWGSNYKMTKLQAAVGLVQLRRLDAMNMKRIKLAQQRNELLRHVAELTLPPEFQGREHVYYRYALLVPPAWAGELRNEVMLTLNRNHGIGSIVADPPTYLTHPWIREHIGSHSLPLAESVAERLFCPALHPLMEHEENESMCEAIIATVQSISRTAN